MKQLFGATTPAAMKDRIEISFNVLNWAKHYDSMRTDAFDFDWPQWFYRL
jgi:hypothetical protein